MTGHATARKCSLLLCLFGFLAVSCKPTAKQLAQTEAYIIGGQDQIRHVIPAVNPDSDPTTAPPVDLIRKLIKASVLIVSPMKRGETRFCSGAHYRTDDGPVIITNRHCFATETKHSEKAPELDPWACIKTQIFMNFDPETATPSMRAGCRPGSLRVNHRLDLAIFKPDVGIDPGIDPDIDPENALELNPSNLGASERLKSVIVHFPDVADKRVRTNLDKFPGAPSTMPRMAITYEDCETAGYFEREAMASDPSLPFAIKHTCDMIQGSSGSALVDAATGNVLGVNWGGIKYGEAADAEAFNIATRAPLVLAFLTMPTKDLTDYLTALADSPPPELIGNGSPPGKVEKTSKSSRISVPGCAKITDNSTNQSRYNYSQGLQKNDQQSTNDSPPSHFDLAWFIFAFYPVFSAFDKNRRRRKR